MDHRCIHCHYLAKKMEQQGLSEAEVVTSTERKKMKIQSCQLDGVGSFHCYKKVWDERTDLGVKDRVYNLIEKGKLYFLSRPRRF